MVRTKLALAGAAALLAATFGGASAQARSGDHARGRNVVGYYIQWGIYARGYTVKNVETSGSASRLTVLNYAFGNVAPDAKGDIVCQSGDPWADWGFPWDATTSVDGEASTWPFQGNFQQLKALKGLHPALKVLMSLGGWTESKYFSDAALTDATRQKLVSSCIDLFIKGNLPDTPPGTGAGVFDGFDIDWEWPGSEGNTGNHIRPEDKQNFTKLVAEFRRQLDALGRGYLLTAFLPAAPAKIDAGFEVNKIFKYLDFGTVQGYDLHGAWEATTNHQSNLFTSRADPSSPRFSNLDTLLAYFARGASPRDLVLGVPFYSRGWAGVPPTNNGLYQQSTGPAPGIWEAGSNDYKAIAPLLAPNSGYTRFNDFRAGASWLYSPTDRTFWTLDDPLVMRTKAFFARATGLDGLMFWELSGDTPDGQLIRAISAGLGDG
jgi:chitinase